MSKTLTKVKLVAAATVLMMGVSACGNAENAGTNADGKAAAGVGNANAAKETYQIEVLSQLSNFAGTQGGWYGKVLKDKFGLELNITAPNLAGGAAKFATLMASGDLGDIIAFGNTAKSIVTPSRRACCWIGRRTACRKIRQGHPCKRSQSDREEQEELRRRQSSIRRRK